MRIECFNTVYDLLDINLHYCGYEDVVPDFFCGPNIRDCYLIHYISKGKGFYEANNQIYSVNEGDIFCIFPDVVTRYYTKKESPWSFYWFAFNGKRVPEVLSRTGITVSSPVRHIIPNNNIPNLVNSLIEVFQYKQNDNTSKILGYLYLLFASLEESYKESENIPTVKSSSSSYIEKAIQYISYNYHKPITVNEISRYTGLDRTYFSKLFHQHTGSSPQEYIMKYRIRKSLELMQAMDLNIDEVCKCVGIPENYYFTRVFKKVMGCTPSQYKKSLK